jgi:hypothetical protein
VRRAQIHILYFPCLLLLFVLGRAADVVQLWSGRDAVVVVRFREGELDAAGPRVQDGKAVGHAQNDGENDQECDCALNGETWISKSLVFLLFTEPSLAMN